MLANLSEGRGEHVTRLCGLVLVEGDVSGF